MPDPTREAVRDVAEAIKATMASEGSFASVYEEARAAILAAEPHVAWQARAERDAAVEYAQACERERDEARALADRLADALHDLIDTPTDARTRQRARAVWGRYAASTPQQSHDPAQMSRNRGCRVSLHEVAVARGCIGPYPCGRNVGTHGTDLPCECEAIQRDNAALTPKRGSDPA